MIESTPAKKLGLGVCGLGFSSTPSGVVLWVETSLCPGWDRGYSLQPLRGQ